MAVDSTNQTYNGEFLGPAPANSGEDTGGGATTQPSATPAPTSTSEPPNPSGGGNNGPEMSSADPISPIEMHPTPATPAPTPAPDPAPTPPMGGMGGGGESTISISVGEPGSTGTPLINSGILHTAPNDNSPISLAIGNGAVVGNLADVHALDGSNGSLVSGDAGAAGGNPLAIAGILTQPTTSSPVGLDVGMGHNVADASLLGGSSLLQNGSAPLASLLGDANGSVISGDAGTTNSSPIAVAGLLTDPTSHGQISADALPGANVVNAVLTGNGDSLNFPNLGGAGADSLHGTVASLPVVNDVGSIAGCDNGGDHSLVDINTNGGELVQLHNDSSSLASLNHTVVI